VRAAVVVAAAAPEEAGAARAQEQLPRQVPSESAGSASRARSFRSGPGLWWRIVAARSPQRTWFPAPAPTDQYRFYWNTPIIMSPHNSSVFTSAAIGSSNQSIAVITGQRQRI